jgi:predicted metalloprotease with PDZ domain
MRRWRELGRVMLRWVRVSAAVAAMAAAEGATGPAWATTGPARATTGQANGAAAAGAATGAAGATTGQANGAAAARAAAAGAATGAANGAAAAAFAAPMPPAAPVAASVAAAPAGRPIELKVDATDAPRGVFHCRLAIPAAPGALTLAYPKWIQGEHTPTGPAVQVAGFAVSAAGRPLPWRRDPLDPFLVHLQVPAGAGPVEVVFDYLSPPEGFGAGYGETPNATPHLAIVDWHDLLVYPPGAGAEAMVVSASLRLPAGWAFDTALAVLGGAGGTGGKGKGAGAAGVERRPESVLTFAPTALGTLIDSPVLAGEHFRTIEVGTPQAPARISIAADRRSALAVPEARIAAYRRLPGEAKALFGVRHYRQYHWLVALGDALDENGLEHHESSDNRGKVNLFTDPAALLRWSNLLPHEYVHSWNGKYRRPAGLTPGDLQAPLRTELLWVYEGLTRYLGDLLLTSRSGLRSLETTHEYLAWVAANQDRNRPGRRWRPLADTAVAVQLLSGAPHAWSAYRRALDYYDESALIWLEADAVMRERSGGTRSLDDFCRVFFGSLGLPEREQVEATAPAVLAYDADDLYAALARLVPYDWRAFFSRRVYEISPRAPLGGLEAAGWKLVYDARPNEYEAARAKATGLVDASFSLGLWLKPDGTIDDIVVGSPAWQAGLGPGMKLVAVGGRKWAPEVLTEEIQAASTGAVDGVGPIEIAAETGDLLRTFEVSYSGGERHPHLERDATRPDLLTAILTPRGAPSPP